MKNKIRDSVLTPSSLVTALIVTILFSGYAKGQVIKSKLDLVSGISAREYIHGGIRYQYTDITQLGFYLGNDLELRNTENISTYCLDHLIHFGTLSFYSNRPVWYARQGFTYSINKIGNQQTRKFTYINLSCGRDFAFNDWLGLNTDLGLICQVQEKIEYTGNPIETPYRTGRRLFPLARVQLFLSF